MFSTTKLNFDLVRKGAPQVAYAVQGDSNTRILEITLRENGATWTPPTDVVFGLAFRKPDGKSGLYDTLPDGTEAISVEGNVVSVTLAPQVLTTDGTVKASLVMQDSNLNRIATFLFEIEVEFDPSAGAQVSNNYYYFSTLDDINKAIGNLGDLQTTDKSSLVAAINAAAESGGGTVTDEQISAAVEAYIKDNPVAESVVSVYVTHNGMADFACEKNFGDVQETILEGVPVVGIFTNSANGETEQILAELHDEDGEIYFHALHGDYIFYADGSWEYDATVALATQKYVNETIDEKLGVIENGSY